MFVLDYYCRSHVHTISCVTNYIVCMCMGNYALHGLYNLFYLLVLVIFCCLEAISVVYSENVILLTKIPTSLGYLCVKKAKYKVFAFMLCSRKIMRSERKRCLLILARVKKKSFVFSSHLNYRSHLKSQLVNWHFDGVFNCSFLWNSYISLYGGFAVFS
jgi:hypothetical protein